MVKSVTTRNEFDNENKGQIVLVIDFSKDGKISKIDSLSGKHTKVKLLRVNCDESSELADSLGVSLFPSIYFFLFGEEKETAVLSGKDVDDVDKIQEKLTQLRDQL